MSRILYTAELFNRTVWEPLLSNAPNNYNRENNIYYFDTERDLTSYWVTTWGGYFDNPTRTDLQIFLNEFLLQVFTIPILEATINSFYVDGTKIYVHLPIKPWQYFTYASELLERYPFISGVRDENNPSNLKIGTINYKPLLEVPTFENKLSDPISGLSLFTTFNFSLISNQGIFDDLTEINYFNTPATIKKSFGVDVPNENDFSIIRRGIVDSVSIDFRKMTIKCNDYTKYFSETVNNIFTIINYPNLPDSVINKTIPIGYGDLYGIELIKITSGFDYIAIDPLFLHSVQTVYNSDNVSISFTVANGIITTLEDASYCDCKGKQNYSIGDIVTELINDFSIFKYLEGNWDVTETDLYLAISPLVGWYCNNLKLKDAVNDLLKNDNAFLISKNDGRLTLRRWGETYSSHTIDSWAIMNERNLKKDFDDAQKYYINICNVKYLKNQKNNEYNATYRNETFQASRLQKYRKNVTGNFDTVLMLEADASDLSERLLERFADYKENIFVELGVDTKDINLLDQVTLNFTVNGRVFTDATIFIVKSVNPAQDTLLLERK